MSKSDILSLIKAYPIGERLIIIEEVLRSIREERELLDENREDHAELYEGKELLEFAGILNKEEAKEMNTAIEESRKIDVDEW